MNDASYRLTSLVFVVFLLFDAAAAQGWQKWTWSGGAWAGMNFAILPGDGIYLLIVDDFVWTPWLITPEFP